MLYRQTIEHCFTSSVTQADLDKALNQLEPALKALKERHNAAASPLLDLPSRTEDLAVIESTAKQLRERFTHIVVAGIGGSGLSGRALLQLAPLAAHASFHFLENIDPDIMDEVLHYLDWPRTCFIIISKSGGTPETLSQFYILLDQVERRLGKEAASEHFILITMPGDSPLRHSATEYHLPIIDHSSDIGGRFAILTAVGLLPAALAGLDIKALRIGAQSVVDEMMAAAHPKHYAPAIGAALQYVFAEKKYPMSVMFPYGERLNGFNAWYRQCWAESLGKQGKGSTPLCAMGATDQHSQVQLYLDGPKDKLFHMIMLEHKGKGQRMRVPDRKDVAYLQGKTMGDLMAAEQHATYKTLVQNQCPVRLFELQQFKEKEMGAFIMHFTLEIILTASLLGINPFDQPAVEQGKKLAREYLLAEQA